MYVRTDARTYVCMYVYIYVCMYVSVLFKLTVTVTEMAK